MLLFLVVPSQDILDEIGVTPDLDGGVGPVILGTPLRSQDGRLAVCHNWAPATKAWFEAYLADVPGCYVLEALPEDWQPLEEEI